MAQGLTAQARDADAIRHSAQAIYDVVIESVAHSLPARQEPGG
jgi:hypothetical protein